MAIEDIRKDEIVGIKDGYIIDRKLLEEMGGLKSKVGEAMLQIADNFFLGPTQESEIVFSMMHVNHSCDPTIGFMGNCVSVAMRDIKAGEELSCDYAMWLSDDIYHLECKCGYNNCRHDIKGNDWRIEELQDKYSGYFSSYIQKKINNF